MSKSFSWDVSASQRRGSHSLLSLCKCNQKKGRKTPRAFSGPHPAAGASRKQRGEAVLALAGRGLSVSCALLWACSASLVCIQWILFLACHQSTACLEVEETNLLTIVRKRRGRAGSRQIESRGKSPASPERGPGPGPAFASFSGPSPSPLQVLLLQEAF